MVRQGFLLLTQVTNWLNLQQRSNLHFPPRLHLSGKCCASAEKKESISFIHCHLLINFLGRGDSFFFFVIELWNKLNNTWIKLGGECRVILFSIESLNLTESKYATRPGVWIKHSPQFVVTGYADGQMMVSIHGYKSFTAELIVDRRGSIRHATNVAEG